VSVAERNRATPSVAPRSALHEWHLARGARMVTREGWPVPAAYGDVATEVAAARAAVAVSERCGARVVELLGPGLEGAAAALGAAETPVGAACPLAAAVARWCRLARDQARILADAVAAVPDLEPGDGVTATDLSSGLTTLQVIGPASPDLLARLIRVDLDPRVFADRRLALTGAAGVPLQVLRWDRGGLLAWELLVGRDVAEYFAGTLEHAGDDLGLRWIGAEAVQQLSAISHQPNSVPDTLFG